MIKPRGHPDPSGKAEKRRHSATEWALFAWTVGIFVAYSIQFKAIFLAILGQIFR